MQGMQGLAAGLGGGAQLASIVSAFCLGTLLLRRARRGGGAPEWLLGLHLLLAIGAGSLLLSIASTSPHLAEPLPPAAYRVATWGGNVATILGLMAALWFNHRVFHGGHAGGRLVALGASALMWLTFAGYVHAGGMQGPDLYGRESWPYVASMIFCDVWLVTDALRYRRQLLRRLELGLADPLVVDRLLLWSLASLARVGLVLIAPIFSATVGTDIGVGLVTGALLGSAVLIAMATVSLWLMLVPSRAYRRWVERRFAGASAPAA